MCAALSSSNNPLQETMSKGVQQQQPTMKDLWNESPTSLVLAHWLHLQVQGLSTTTTTTTDVVPEIKLYPDAVYYNYFQLGLSILFQPAAGYKPGDRSQLNASKLSLKSIDVYNESGGKYGTYPNYPLDFSHSSTRAISISITAQTPGKDFVRALGEPERKGGGSGPMSGSIGLWCEWSRLGLMVELGGDDVRGPQAWDKGGDATWKTITLFAPASTPLS